VRGSVWLTLSVQLYRSLLLHDHIPYTLAFFGVDKEIICSLVLDRSFICYRSAPINFGFIVISTSQTLGSCSSLDGRNFSSGIAVVRICNASVVSDQHYPVMHLGSRKLLYSISDVTAIWNTNAFFAYLITVKVFRLKWEPLRLVAVLIATLGVIVVVYGGTTSPPSDKSHLETSSADRPSTLRKPTAPLIGDVLTLLGSICYGFYQVMYKKYIALPSDPEVASEGLYAQIPASEEPQADALHEPSDGDTPDMVYPPPFGLHPNLMTSAIGLCTLIILWIPLPFLHYLDIEPFALPSNIPTVLAIMGIALGGVIFNAGFMVSKFTDYC
jgi:drug/metabolite transporter (DMT)-like permease